MAEPTHIPLPPVMLLRQSAEEAFLNPWAIINLEPVQGYLGRFELYLSVDIMSGRRYRSIEELFPCFNGWTYPSFSIHNDVEADLLFVSIPNERNTDGSLGIFTRYTRPAQLHKTQ